MEPIFKPDQPKRDKMIPKETQELHGPTKIHFPKKWFSRGTVYIFSLLKHPKRTSRGQRDSQEAPKELLNPKKKRSKIDPKSNNICNKFGTKMGPKMDSKTTPKRKKKSTNSYLCFYECLMSETNENHYFDVFQHHF